MAVGIYSQLSDYIAQVRVLIHDPNSSDYSDAQLTTIINEMRIRVAQELRCCKQFLTGLNTISQQETYPLSGFVGGVIVNAGGTNYATATTASFINAVGDTTGSGAAAAVTVVSGVITQILMTNWGGGYTLTPTLTLQNVGSGSGANLSVIAGLGIIDVLQMTCLWNGAPSSLSVTYNWLSFGVFQAFCRMYRQFFSNPGAFTVHYGTISPTSRTQLAQRVFMFPIPNQAFPLEIDALTLPVALALATDVDYQLIPPWNDAVQYLAAQKCYLGLQQYSQADEMLSLYRGRLMTLPTGYARRVHSFYRTFKYQAKRLLG